MFSGDTSHECRISSAVEQESIHLIFEPRLSYQALRKADGTLAAVLAGRRVVCPCSLESNGTRQGAQPLYSFRSRYLRSEVSVQYIHQLLLCSLTDMSSVHTILRPIERAWLHCLCKSSNSVRFLELSARRTKRLLLSL